MDSKPIRLGGLWLNTSKSGIKYMSGSFGFAQILVFKNDNKQKDNDPDYTICIAEKPQKENGRKQDDDDDVPF